jgi:hypothetical protein
MSDSPHELIRALAELEEAVTVLQTRRQRVLDIMARAGDPEPSLITPQHPPPPTIASG